MPTEKETQSAMENRWLKSILGVFVALVGFFVQQTYVNVRESLDKIEAMQTDVLILKNRDVVRPQDFYELRGEVRTLRMRLDRIQPPRHR